MKPSKSATLLSTIILYAVNNYLIQVHYVASFIALFLFSFRPRFHPSTTNRFPSFLFFRAEVKVLGEMRELTNAPVELFLHWCLQRNQPPVPWPQPHCLACLLSLWWSNPTLQQSTSPVLLQSGLPWDCLLIYACHHPLNYPAIVVSTLFLSLQGYQDVGQTVPITTYAHRAFRGSAPVLLL